MSRVICAGHVNWDVTLRVDSLPEPDGEACLTEQVQSGGGSASNTAVALTGLDLAVTLLGSVGDDDHGSLVRAELEDCGVDCGPLRTVPDAVTTVKYLIVDDSGQVMVLANDGVNEAFRPTDLPADTLARADHIHLTGQRPATAATLADRAKAAGLSVSIDPGRRVGDRDFTRVVSRADYLFVNDREAATARETGLLDAVAGVTVLKRGDGGGGVLADGDSIDHPGFAVEAVDTAGAGDAFAAGFLAARLDGAPLERSLAVANACGAVASRSVGARTSLSWERVETLLETS